MLREMDGLLGDGMLDILNSIYHTYFTYIQYTLHIHTYTHHLNYFPIHYDYFT